MEPWLLSMQAADEAETRGDAVGALDVMLRRPLDSDGRLFWRPDRLDRLTQLIEHAPHLPAWAHSRWILAQAAQALSVDERSRAKRLRAMGIARELSGMTSDKVDDCALMDHDWFYRQVLLYEQDALGDFIRCVAAPDLLAGADRISEWADTPMGGYVYRGATRGQSTWTDLATDRTITLDDIGSGSMLRPGLAAIGRLVPAGDTAMFESIPQEAPLEVALAVARHPASWLNTVRAAGDEFRYGEIISHVAEFGLLTDVPHAQWVTWLAEWCPGRANELLTDPRTLARAVIDRAGVELGKSQHRYLPEGDQWDAEEFEGWEPWSCLSASLLLPGVIGALACIVNSDDVAVIAQLRDRVAEPPRSLLSLVVTQEEAA